ncbi:MAG: amidohydrolase family protein [Actinomycetota bacterium]
MDKSPMIIDVHTHFIPPEFLNAADHPAWGAAVERRDGHRWVVHDEGFAYPLNDGFLGNQAKLDDMDARGIDFSIMSLAPTLFYYWIDTADAVSFSRMANDSLAETVAGSRGRLAGTASLPMQDPDAAADEYRRCIQELGFVGAHVGTTIEGEYVDRDAYLPLWEAVNELGAPVILHPYYIGPKVGYEDYYLTNIFVNPLDTALAAGRLIFSGLFDRFENLKFLLVHAGGFLPYQIGRFDHGWKVRQEARISLDRPPSEYLDRFYFDTITHHDRALKWLIDLVGNQRVVLGTDLPFDMADEDPVGRLDRVADSEETRQLVGGSTASELFDLEEAALLGKRDDLGATR